MTQRLESTLAGGRGAATWRDKQRLPRWSPGRSVAAWDREMRHLVRPWAVVRRAAAWLPGLLAPSPHLRSRPLLGDCLAALTGHPAEAAPPAAEASRRAPRTMEADSRVARRSRSRIEPTARRRRGDRPVPTTGGERTRATIPEAVERQVSRGLLDRLAGDAPARRRDVAAPAVSKPGRDRPNGTRLPMPRDRPRRDPPAWHQAPGRERSPIGELAARVLKVLRRAPSGATTSGAATSGAAMSGTDPRSRARSRTEVATDTSPEPQGQILDGEAAPRRLLDRWLATPDHGPRATPRGSSTSDRGHRSGASRPFEAPAAGRTPGRRAPDPPRPGAAAAGGTAGGGASPTGASPATESRRQAPGRQAPRRQAPGRQAQRRQASVSPAPSSARPGDAPAPPAPGRGRPAAEEAAPASPSLLPSSAADFANPGTTARVLDAARRRSEVAPGEDLGALADRLGRLLAEEARRHGIDV